MRHAMRRAYGGILCACVRRACWRWRARAREAHVGANARVGEETAAAIGACKPLSVCLSARDDDDDGGVSRGCVVRWRLRPWCVGDGSDDDADARRACTGRVGVYDETARRMSD